MKNIEIKKDYYSYKVYLNGKLTRYQISNYYSNYYSIFVDGYREGDLFDTFEEAKQQLIACYDLER